MQIKFSSRCYTRENLRETNFAISVDWTKLLREIFNQSQKSYRKWKCDESCFIKWTLIRNFKFHSCYKDGQRISLPSGLFAHATSCTVALHYNCLYCPFFFTSTPAKQSWMELTASNGNIPSQFTTKWTHTLYTQPRSDHSNHCAMKWWGMTLCCHRTMITISWTTTSSRPGNSATMCLTYQQVRMRMFWATHR